MQIRNGLLCLALLASATAVTAETSVFSWVDENGKTHYSDKKPAHENGTSPIVAPQNVLNFERSNSSTAVNTAHTTDNFNMPRKRSKVSHRFSLTSGINVDVPKDRLRKIQITLGQKSLHAYVKLIGVDKNRPYNMHYRVLDAKNELIFDKGMRMSSHTNSLWFSATITPAVSIDAPGMWTFQGILDGERLFVEKREVLF